MPRIFLGNFASIDNLTLRRLNIGRDPRGTGDPHGQDPNEELNYVAKLRLSGVMSDSIRVYLHVNSVNVNIYLYYVYIYTII